MEELKSKQNLIGNNSTAAKAVRGLLNYCAREGLLTKEQAEEAKTYAKIKPSRADNYVPTAEEVRTVLNALPRKHHPIYLVLLYSGIRETELEYLLKNCAVLRTQHMTGFIKVEMNWIRGQKSSFFAYLPATLALEGSLPALKSWIHKRKLLSLKYLRKFFYTEAISAGCPSEIADFIQGRVQRTVGGNHYLAVQMLADQWYPKIAARISDAFQNK